MPTVHKPILDHRPLEVGESAGVIEAFLDTHLTRLIKLGRGDGVVMEDDDLEPIRREFSRRLVVFALKCKARPVRSTNKIIATLKHIAKHPQEFIANAEAYDPEATDALFVEFQRLSPDHKRIIHDFWAGQGKLDPEDVRQVALAAVIGYKSWRSEQGKHGGKKPRGAPANQLLREFALLAAGLFTMVGGIPTATDEGRFRQFVDLLRMPVLEIAMEAGCALTPVSIIRLAARNQAKAPAKAA